MHCEWGVDADVPVCVGRLCGAQGLRGKGSERRPDVAKGEEGVEEMTGEHDWRGQDKPLFLTRDAADAPGPVTKSIADTSALEFVVFVLCWSLEFSRKSTPRKARSKWGGEVKAPASDLALFLPIWSL